MAIISRNETPPTYKNFRSYKRCLRRDFHFRCGYCTIHEGEFDAGGTKSFCVDHFRPKHLFLDLKCVYSNLYYACRHCNENKGGHWPSEALESAGFRFLDPCVDDYYGRHLFVEPDGRIVPQSKAGAYTVDHIRLNRPYLKRLRQSRYVVAVQIAVVRKLLDQVEKDYSVPRGAVRVVRDRLAELERRHLFPSVPYELVDQR